MVSALVLKMAMKRNKILINVENLNDIKDYEELGVINFLFPLKGYSIGYASFSFEEIAKQNGNIYVLVNRLLTDVDIDNFLKLDIPKNVKGFIIEDVGLYEALKDKNYELINFQNHLNNNYKTINYWLKYYDSLVISTDITLEEINKILNEAKKPLVLNAFSMPMIMYSRRKLINNYYKHYELEPKKTIKIEEKISNKHFLLKEQEEGTALFNNAYTDLREVITDELDSKIKFYMINTFNIPKDIICRVIKGESIKEANSGFLHQKTVYKVGDLK